MSLDLKNGWEKWCFKAWWEKWSVLQNGWEKLSALKFKEWLGKTECFKEWL